MRFSGAFHSENERKAAPKRPRQRLERNHEGRLTHEQAVGVAGNRRGPFDRRLRGCLWGHVDHGSKRGNQGDGQWGRSKGPGHSQSGDSAFDQDRSIPDQAASFRAISRDFTVMAQGLQALSFPASAQADSKTLILAFSKLSHDASEIASATDKMEVRAIVTKMDDDEETAKAASDTLRNDLGLPPAG